jgi:Cu-Zn family superoxide dismutase
MGLLFWLFIVFIIWLFYLELSPKLGKIIFRPNAKGSTTFNLSGLGSMMIRPFTDLTFWYPRFWDLNIYMLWIITAIIYYLIYRNLNLFEYSKPLKAIAILSGNSRVEGVVEFIQETNQGPLKIQGQINGLKEGLHGFHIHEFGDITNGCDSAGPHYNPQVQDHGGLQDNIRHAGDLGNIVANKRGIANINIVDPKLKLNGEYSILGRTIVVHADPDDLGKGDQKDSKTTGHSGKRLACGVIGIKSGEV